jgi:transposase
LEAGRFIGDWRNVCTGEMNWTQLKLLIEGIEEGRQRKRYRHAAHENNHAGTAQ